MFVDYEMIMTVLQPTHRTDSMAILQSRLQSRSMWNNLMIEQNEKKKS